MNKFLLTGMRLFPMLSFMNETDKEIYGRPTNLAESILSGGQQNRLLTYWRPKGSSALKDYAVSLKIGYAGRTPGAVLRLLLHRAGLCGGTMGHDETLFPHTPLGMLGDPAVRGTRGETDLFCIERTTPGDFNLRISATPKVDFELIERQDTYWSVRPVGYKGLTFYTEIPCPEELRGPLTFIREAAGEQLKACMTLHPVSPPRKTEPQAFRLAAGTHERGVFPETPWVTYFCDPSGGVGAFAHAPFGPDGPLPVSSDPGRPWNCGSDRALLFDTLGVLVTASPGMSEVADNIRIRVSAEQGSCRFSCEIPVGELKKASRRQDLPFGWVGSVPFSLPFAPCTGKGGKVKLELIAGKAELGMIQEVEDMCSEWAKERGICESPEFLGVTPYLVGIGYFDY